MRGNVVVGKWRRTAFGINLRCPLLHRNYLQLLHLYHVIVLIIYAMQADWIISSHRPPGEWPHQGRIEIERFDLRYREQLPLVLRDVNCVIGAKEKVRVA